LCGCEFWAHFWHPAFGFLPLHIQAVSFLECSLWFGKNGHSAAVFWSAIKVKIGWGKCGILSSFKSAAASRKRLAKCQKAGPECGTP